MGRRKITFDNLKFFTKKTLRKYTSSQGVLLDKNQRNLTKKSVNEEESSFRRKGENHGLLSTQQLPLDNSNFANNTFFGSAEVKVNVAFDKIINKYPFEGTFDEIERFEDSLSSFEKYVLDSFPKSTGFLRFDSDNKEFIQVKDDSGNLSHSLIKNEPGKSYINPGSKSFSVECKVRLPVDRDLNQNSYLFYCIGNDTNQGTKSGFAAYFESAGHAKNTLTVNDTTTASTTFLISDFIRTVTFTFDNSINHSASVVNGTHRTSATSYKVATGGITDNNSSEEKQKVATSIKNSIELAKSNFELLVSAEASGVVLNLTQVTAGLPSITAITGTALSDGSPKVLLADSFSNAAPSDLSTVKFVLLSGSNSHVSASHEIKKGQWHNLSFVYDRETSQQKIMIMSGSRELSSSESFFKYDGINTLNSDLYIADGPTSLSHGFAFDKVSSFSGSIDEFRVFHNLRNASEVDYYERRGIFSHDNLRLLLSFNEPTGSHSNNDIVLDRSGNSLHTKITNYSTSMRNPADIKNPMVLEDSRFFPVLFPSHEDVINLNTKLLNLATEYDINNPNLITKLIPKHYLEEGANEEGFTIDGDIVEAYSNSQNLPKNGSLGSTQIMSMLLYFLAEELDAYKMYLDQVSQLLFPDYEGKDGTADAFLQSLAKYYGFELPNIFGEVAEEQFSGRENLGLEHSTYEKSLSEVQNLVWRRVLKNLQYILSAKGTKHAIRALFRSSGMEPDRLFRLVEYHGKNEFRLGSSRQSITEMSTMLNFSGSIDFSPPLAKGDGTFTNRPTLISSPLTGSRIEPGFPELSGKTVLASGKLSFHPTIDTNIPPANTKVTIQDAYDNLNTLEFVDALESAPLASASPGTASITVADGDAAWDGTGENDYIELTSTNGKVKRYVIVYGGGDGKQAVPTGTILATDSDTGSGTAGANATRDGVDTNNAVAVNLLSSYKQNDILSELKAAIEHVNGHGGEIIVGGVPPRVDGNQSISLKQSRNGTFGNTSSVRSVANGTPISSVSNFTNGTNILVSRKDLSSVDLTIDDANQAHGTTEKDFITLTTDTGQSKKYVFVHGGAGGNSAVPTGTILAANSNTGTGQAGADLVGGIAVNIVTAGGSIDTKNKLLSRIREAIVHTNGHSNLVECSAVLEDSLTLTIKNVNSTKTSTLTRHGSGYIPAVSYTNRKSYDLLSAFSSTLTGSFVNKQLSTLTNVSSRSANNSNVDTLTMTSRDTSRLNLGNHAITVTLANGNPSSAAATNSPYIQSTNFSGGNGFVNAGNQGYESSGVSATKKDGLFTSGSWTIDGMYQFPSSLPEGKRRSLSRLVVSGSSTSGGWENKYGVLTNLVASSTGDQLSLHVRSSYNTSAPAFVLHLTGANVYNGQKWYVAYGRKRNDEIGNNSESMYFIRAASYRYDTVSVFLSTEGIFDEVSNSGNTPETNVFQSTNNDYWSAPCILIGEQTFARGDQNQFLNKTSESAPDPVIPDEAHVDYFDGKVGHLKFWSKALTEDESFEHARNFKSVGVKDVLVNNTFSNSRTGSFEKLRLNISTDQPQVTTNSSGVIKLTDFSQTFTHDKVAKGITTHSSGAFCYGFEPNAAVIENTRFDYTILSPFFDEYLDDDKIKIAGFSEGKNIKAYNSKVAPVTEILPFERELVDNRFEIQVNLQRAVNEDIMNIFASMDSLDNALGKPELIFSQTYPDLRHMRNLYFNRLTDKVNYRNFFDLFRWLDDAFSGMIEKMVPRNSNFLGINLIIESHALERYKIAYGHKDIYMGEDERAGLRSVLLVSQRSGVIRRF